MPNCQMQGCKKKLPLATFPCKCGNSYCSLHKSDVIHSCSYDYKAEQRKYLSSMLEKVVVKQVEII